MARNREQKLVDLCFEIGMAAAKSWKNSLGLEGEQEQVAKWIAKQLEDCGFPTRPVGMSWGMLLDCEMVPDGRIYYAMGCKQCKTATTYQPECIGDVMIPVQHQCSKCTYMLEQVGYDSEERRDEWMKEMRGENGTS